MIYTVEIELQGPERPFSEKTCNNSVNILFRGTSPLGVAEPLDSNWIPVSGIIKITRSCYQTP